MSRSSFVPNAAEPEESSGLLDRLHRLNQLGDIDLVEGEGLTISAEKSAAAAPRIQALSDHITALEEMLSEQSQRASNGQSPDLTGVLEEMSASRAEIAALYDMLLSQD